MIFKKNKHNFTLYNNLLFLSRNIFFYKDLNFKDSFETRIYLMFFHYSIILIISKQKKYKIDQANYNNFFLNIENNLRELGLGDVSVNKKMKDLNKLFYDILLKLNLDESYIRINVNLVGKYFDILNQNTEKMEKCEKYFVKLYEFCFDKTPENMIQDLKKFKF